MADIFSSGFIEFLRVIFDDCVLFVEDSRFKACHGFLWAFTLVIVTPFCNKISGSVCISLAQANRIKIFLENNIHIQFAGVACA
jgi:hypothetical protein